MQQTCLSVLALMFSLWSSRVLRVCFTKRLSLCMPVAIILTMLVFDNIMIEKCDFPQF